MGVQSYYEASQEQPDNLHCHRFLLAVDAALLAALYPAWRLSRMQAAEALRGE
jgi:ABC-type lipoprotein release transport system permease subunit